MRNLALVSLLILHAVSHADICQVKLRAIVRAERFRQNPDDKLRLERWIQQDNRVAAAINSSKPKFFVVPQEQQFYGEDVVIASGKAESVRYLRTLDERNPFLLEIKNGRIYNRDGTLFDTRDGTYTHREDGILKTKPIDAAIFVMDEDGRLYSHKHQHVDRWKHSSLVGGGVVASAGEWTVHDGIPVRITDRSGHYFPPRFLTEQLLRELQIHSVDISLITLVLYSPLSANSHRKRFTEIRIPDAMIERILFPLLPVTPKQYL